MAKRQGRGDYAGGSTVVTASGWGFSKPERSLSAKQLKRRQAREHEAQAAIHAARSANAKRKPKRKQEVP